jgi:hypothetical protein
VSRRFRVLSSVKLLWQPAADRWSVAHCLSHLSRVGEEYGKKLEPEIRRARAGIVSRGPVRGSWFGRWFTNPMGPGKESRTRAPGLFRPDAEGDPVGAAEWRHLAQTRAVTMTPDSPGAP